jgi:hypothetical protein
VNSFRQHAACVGASGNFSVMRDVLGFVRGRLPPHPDGGGSTVSVSMREQIDAIAGRHVHLNVIRVGFDALSSAEQALALQRIDWALLRARQIYAPVSLGVGRVLHWVISRADADGADDICSEDEAEELWNDWTVPNNGLDVFMVRTISADFIGLSPVDGACDKDDKDDGLVGGRIDRDPDGVARTFAHEIGHYLGRSHTHGADCPTGNAARNRLMSQTRCALSNRDSVNLTSGEGGTMRGHCTVRPGC